MADAPRPKPKGVLRPDFRFVDLESSGLHHGSFPIEVGWSDDGLNAVSKLVRPAPEWTLARWNVQAQKVHGISWERVNDEGVPVAEVADWVDAVLTPCSLVLSDNPDADAKWLDTLFRAARRPRRFNVMEEITAFVVHERLHEDDTQAWFTRHCLAVEMACLVFPHPHRAAEDSVRLASTFRICVDPGFDAACRGWALENDPMLRRVSGTGG